MYNLEQTTHKKGFLQVGNTFIKALGCILAIVIERLILEFQHALKNNFVCDNYFCINVVDLAMQTGLTEENCLKALNKLNELGLIEIMKVERFFKVCIKKNKIVSFLQTKEQEQGYIPWNFSLFNVQKEGFGLMQKANNSTTTITANSSWDYELARDENGNILQF